MAKKNKLKQFVLVIFGTAMAIALWLTLDAPVGSGQTLDGVVVQAVYVPARYSGGYTRIVVRLVDGTTVTFQRYGQSFYKQNAHVSVLVKQRRLSGLRGYTLL